MRFNHALVGKEERLKSPALPTFERVAT